MFLDQTLVMRMVFSHVTSEATKALVASSSFHQHAPALPPASALQPAPASAPAASGAGAAHAAALAGDTAAGEAPGPPPGGGAAVAALAALLNGEGGTEDDVAARCTQLYRALSPAAKQALKDTGEATSNSRKPFSKLTAREKSAKLVQGWDFLTRLGGGVETLSLFVCEMMQDHPELLVAALRCNPSAHEWVMRSVAAESQEAREMFAAMVRMGSTQDFYNNTLRPLAQLGRASHL